jgi:hypothetical protein
VLALAVGDRALIIGGPHYGTAGLVMSLQADWAELELADGTRIKVSTLWLVPYERSEFEYQFRRAEALAPSNWELVLKRTDANPAFGTNCAYWAAAGPPSDMPIVARYGPAADEALAALAEAIEEYMSTPGGRGGRTPP